MYGFRGSLCILESRWLDFRRVYMFFLCQFLRLYHNMLIITRFQMGGKWLGFLAVSIEYPFRIYLEPPFNINDPSPRSYTIANPSPKIHFT